ncbi:hypothetical protein NPIL_40171 [Nephila pilipes]|uniref:Uncharacterized protein n=1 Tax=Nephila pilipes TaxID=299642 RepID=A0A8X6UA40_NEPPI|nr:hypothetical protein NPIL_40171 [Nephila pilipes]
MTGISKRFRNGYIIDNPHKPYHCVYYYTLLTQTFETLCNVIYISKLLIPTLNWNYDPILYCMLQDNHYPIVSFHCRSNYSKVPDTLTSNQTLTYPATRPEAVFPDVDSYPLWSC